jgi:hypothetical protein
MLQIADIDISLGGVPPPLVDRKQCQSFLTSVLISLCDNPCWSVGDVQIESFASYDEIV